MSTASQIPRNSIIWLLLAQLVVILPHTGRMSWWMIAIWLLCALWRMAMFRGEASYPGRAVRGVLVMLGSIGVAVSFGSVGGLDFAVALLILAFSLKLIEVRTRRDMFLVFNLALFIVAASFLFSQSVFLALYQIGSIVLIFTAMVATQHALHNRAPLLSLRKSLRLVAQAVPVMLLFFLVFPRIPPIWSVPTSGGGAGTGMSDSIEPGDIAKLNQSSKLAFVVEFESTRPPSIEMYWRGITLEDFDGRKWSAADSAVSVGDRSRREELTEQIELYGVPLRYTLIVEPTKKNWLFALPVAQLQTDADRAGMKGIFYTADYNLRKRTPLSERSELKVESYLDYRADWTLSQQARKNNLRLPRRSNPRARSLAQQMYARTGSTEQFVLAMQRYFLEKDFFYTLEPPELGRHTVDEFVFDTRKGYCEHYANAFAFMLRAAGVPARVVVGYQGGEVNPHNNTLSVRQLDAHAWLEYWQAGEGWLRLDPTYTVAPERINFGLEGALARRPELGASRLSPLYLRNLAMIKSVRLRLDAINHSWQRWVVNFDASQQRRVFERLMGSADPWKLGLIVAGVLGAMLALLSFIILRPGAKDTRSPEHKLYRRFCRKMQKRLQLRRGKAETPLAFAARIAAQAPQCAEQADAITRQYMQIAYAGESGLKQFKRSVERFRPRRPAS
ncbi:MAG: DUF3488 and transglutaminase-like domain-containing protein [Gammaproteobacteria bacterium]|nr:DUF3488 and transglutaminase-like domain-containing protein [Gammaproteobacteria bacterium]MBT8150872.1 DUF3488 and transglutaminase-like domain-containing protein [Gammaproteobacteria bacterium]NND38032.1 DUF3488 domain-containing transglutaminase family protein [Pseudomonadales bacterium]NNM10629.1 DUF3488 domain-containing transglutaminase family protein [Pseudomonadales bacterium]RZV60018.1 MAG: DUF3488 domain-containing protein [Pseudomonadales bacterium]